MPHADRSERLAYMKRWRQKNREQYMRGIKKSNARRLTVLRDYLIKIKAESACIKCGEDTDCCLDFHHRDPATKSFAVSQGPTRKVSLRRFQAEINKCDILCANCHRKLHAGLVLVAST